MQTVYDWLTVLTFSGLSLMFLLRSKMEEPPDKIWQYLPPAVGCALADYLGNAGFALPAVVTFVISLAYIYHVLNPKLSD